MSCCCKRVYRLCDAIVCDALPLVLPVEAAADVEYTFELDFLNAVLRKTTTGVTGQPLAFDKEDLNERFTYVGRVLDAADAVVTFTVEDVEYDCIEFTTKRCILCPPSTGSSSAS